MNISSKITYLLPTILLLIPCYYISFIAFEEVNISFISSFLNMYIIFPISLSLIFFFLFKIFTNSKFLNFLKYTIIILPLLLTKILIYFTKSYYDPGAFFSLVFGCILYLAFTEFLYRYTAVLNEDSISFENILGCSQIVNLIDVVKVEQKFNLLGLLKVFRILNLSKKTIVSFMEDRNEYEIKFFARVGKGNDIFQNIIIKAGKLGNQKIRQYGY